MVTDQLFNIPTSLGYELEKRVFVGKDGKQYYNHAFTPSSSNKSFFKLVFLFSSFTNPWEREAFAHLVDGVRANVPTEKLPDLHLFDAQNSQKRLADEGLHWISNNQHCKSMIVVTFGPMTSVLAQSEMVGWQSWIRQMFIGVDSPEELRLTYVNGMPKPGIMGVKSVMAPLREQIRLLKELRPDVARAVLPYGSPSAHLCKEKEHVVAALKEFGYQTSTEPLYAAQHLDFIINYRVRHNTLLYMTGDSYVHTQFDEIARRGTEKGALVATSHLTGMAHGAAVGIGNTGAEYGRVAADMLTTFYDQGYLVGEPSIQVVAESPTIRHNLSVFEQQGIQLTPEQKRLLGSLPVTASDELWPVSIKSI